jgi:hypothetical protein
MMRSAMIKATKIRNVVLGVNNPVGPIFVKPFAGNPHEPI